jgi:hypothetical protein
VDCKLKEEYIKEFEKRVYKKWNLNKLS